jgi:hypothetical protein
VLSLMGGPNLWGPDRLRQLIHENRDLMGLWIA